MFELPLGEADSSHKRRHLQYPALNGRIRNGIVTEDDCRAQIPGKHGYITLAVIRIIRCEWENQAPKGSQSSLATS